MGSLRSRRRAIETRLVEQGLHVGLDQLGEVGEELGRVRAVDVAVVAGEGDRHLLDHANHAWVRVRGGVCEGEGGGEGEGEGEGEAECYG